MAFRIFFKISGHVDLAMLINFTLCQFLYNRKKFCGRIMLWFCRRRRRCRPFKN